MAEEISAIVIAEGAIVNKIYWIRGQKVMLDRDLAELYGVETKHLKRQVKRNIDRFPEDFMFELNDEEFEDWRCQIGTSNLEASGAKMGLRHTPYAFTEQGVAMLSSVLNSARAIKVNKTGATGTANPAEYGRYPECFCLSEAAAGARGAGGAGADRVSAAAVGPATFRQRRQGRRAFRRWRQGGPTAHGPGGRAGTGRFSTFDLDLPDTHAGAATIYRAF